MAVMKSATEEWPNKQVVNAEGGGNVFLVKNKIPRLHARSREIYRSYCRNGYFLRYWKLGFGRPT